MKPRELHHQLIEELFRSWQYRKSMQEKKQRVAVIGATGAVGQEIVRLLISRKFPYVTLRLFAQERSLGKTVHSFPIEVLKSLDEIDLAFFAAGSTVSKQWIPNAKCICIDSSS